MCWSCWPIASTDWPVVPCARIVESCVLSLMNLALFSVLKTQRVRGQMAIYAIMLALVQQWQKEQWKLIAAESHKRRKRMWVGGEWRLAGSIGCQSVHTTVPSPSLLHFFLDGDNVKLWMQASEAGAKRSSAQSVTAVYGLQDTDPRLSMSPLSTRHPSPAPLYYYYYSICFPFIIALVC